MSIALERIDVEPSSSGFIHGAAMSFGLIFESSPAPVASSSSSSSSLGKNSDVSSGRSVDEGDEKNDEAQSSYKGPLDMMEALEEVLPIRHGSKEGLRRGISKFYNYKSKSFTSLAEAATSSSIKKIAKPDDPYTRKRRNMLASNLRICRGGISKSSKSTITASQSTLALAIAMCSEESSPSTSGDSNLSSLAPPSFNKLGNHSAWRSLSLADLQECATSAAVNTTSRFFPSHRNMQQ